MNWLTVAWSMCAGVCVTLALMHSFLWSKNRSEFAYLLSTLMALSAGAIAITELSLLRTQSIATYQLLLQWSNLFVYLLIIPMVWLVYVRLDSSQRWLAQIITAMWSVALIFNFISPGSLVYTHVEEIKRQTTYWGEQFSVAVGPANPWVLLANIAVLLILVYVLIAAIKAWRRREQRRAILIGGGVVVFMLFGGIHSMLVDSGIVATPYMVSFAYLAIVVTMSYELVSDAMQAPKLAREVEANQKRWIDLLNNVQLAVIAIDPKGLITYHNPFFEKLTGYSTKELYNRSTLSLLPENERAELNLRLEDMAQTGPRPHSQWTIVCASGEERQLAWSSVRQVDNEGNYSGILSVGADITDGLLAQKELQHSQSELERLTRASMLGELVSALAHELNQPLTAILSNSQAVLRFMDNDQVDMGELHDILEDIVRDDKRAGEVIHSMRAMLRKGEIKREWFDLKHALDEVLTILHNELDAKSIQVELDFSEDLPQIEAGRVEIQQVLMNLLLNAVRALQSTPTEQRFIQLQAHIGQGNTVCTIIDHGAGIKAEDIPNIFTAFYSTNSTGMGMGLAICKRIIEAHGGTIEAKNREKGGSIFSFTLPIRPDHG